MQLDLLAWAPPLAYVIPFPTNRRIGHIRRTAGRIYNSRTDREAEDYWRRAVDGLRRQMEKAGVDEIRIGTEIIAFHDSVQAEMVRLARQPCRPGGDAA